MTAIDLICYEANNFAIKKMKSSPKTIYQIPGDDFAMNQMLPFGTIMKTDDETGGGVELVKVIYILAISCADPRRMVCY